MATAEQVAEALSLLGAAYRGDWSDFDGRTLRSQLDELAEVLRTDALFSVDRWAYGTVGICPVSRSWTEHCRDKRPDSHYSECKHIQEYYESLEPKKEIV